MTELQRQFIEFCERMGLTIEDREFLKEWGKNAIEDRYPTYCDFVAGWQMGRDYERGRCDRRVEMSHLLVGIGQGSAALDGKAVDCKTCRELTKQTYFDLHNQVIDGDPQEKYVFELENERDAMEEALKQIKHLAVAQEFAHIGFSDEVDQILDEIYKTAKKAISENES